MVANDESDGESDESEDHYYLARTVFLYLVKQYGTLEVSEKVSCHVPFYSH